MKRITPPPASVPELEATAHHQARLQDYKGAIASLKELLKRERRRDWEERLAAAYLARARQLAQKGMYQEAAILWRNQADLHPGLPASAEYLGWLLQGGQWARLGEALGSAVALGESREGRRLLEAVALLALDRPELREALPAGHPIVAQAPLLRQAVEAYAAGRDEVLAESLRDIASRSPYRNLRVLLRGLSLLESDPAAGAASLLRVEEDSVLRDFALALAAPPVTPGQGPSLPPRQQAVRDRLAGLTKPQLALLRDLERADRSHSARPLFDAVIQHRSELGDGPARRFCLALLVGCPEAIPVFERAFGPLGEFERQRLWALHQEERQDHPAACEHWRGCLELLQRAPAAEQEPLSQALIYRHIAELAEADVPFFAGDCLEKSLALDPDDLAAHLKLIRLAEHDGEPKRARSWLERALKQFPKDPEVLVLAMQSAQRRQTYKKLAGYAKALLAIDPINRQARRFLLEAHLGHARKQLKARKLELAGRELAAARRLDPQRRSVALRYAEGLLIFLGAANDEECRACWREAWQTAGGGVPAWLQWAMEVQAAGLPLTSPERLIVGLDKRHVADRRELVALSRLLGAYAESSPDPLGTALNRLAPILKRSFKETELTGEDYLGLCQGLAAAGQFDLLGECTKQAARRQASPAFVYFQTVANCRGDVFRLGPIDELRLQAAAEEALRTRDRRTAALIERFLRQRELGVEFGEDFDEGDETAAETGRAVSERLGELLPDVDPERLRELSPLELMKLLAGRLLGGGGEAAGPRGGKGGKLR